MHWLCGGNEAPTIALMLAHKQSKLCCLKATYWIQFAMVNLLQCDVF